MKKKGSAWVSGAVCPIPEHHKELIEKENHAPRHAIRKYIGPWKNDPYFEEVRNEN